MSGSQSQSLQMELEQSCSQQPELLAAPVVSVVRKWAKISQTAWAFPCRYFSETGSFLTSTHRRHGVFPVSSQREIEPYIDIASCPWICHQAVFFPEFYRFNWQFMLCTWEDLFLPAFRSEGMATQRTKSSRRRHCRAMRMATNVAKESWKDKSLTWNHGREKQVNISYMIPYMSIYVYVFTGQFGISWSFQKLFNICLMIEPPTYIYIAQ